MKRKRTAAMKAGAIKRQLHTARNKENLYRSLAARVSGSARQHWEAEARAAHARITDLKNKLHDVGEIANAR